MSDGEKYGNTGIFIAARFGKKIVGRLDGWNKPSNLQTFQPFFTFARFFDKYL
jgi:hypothetical protein